MPRSASPPRVFLLSPAHGGGKRAELLLSERARFPLARRLRAGERVALGEAFSFLSGLYFRGKLTYAREFARPRRGLPGVQVITANQGLLAPETAVGADDLRSFGMVDIRPDDPRYRAPLERDLARLAAHGTAEIVLLGSVATGKYLDVLLDVVGERLLFPTDFVGRGDMSRGALLLRAARERTELAYEPASTAVRRGRRPGKVGVPHDHDTSDAETPADADSGNR
jgi:hypothetical protein